MRGPDFEMPSVDPPVPPTPVIPLPKRPFARRLRAAGFVVVVGISGVGAIAWLATREGTSTSRTPASNTLPSTSPTDETPSTSTSLTRRTTTTRIRAAQVARTCVDSNEEQRAANGSSPEGYPWITFHVSPRAARQALIRIAEHASEARQAFGDAGALGLRVYCDLEEFATASGRSPEDVQQSLIKGEMASMWHGDIWLYGPSFDKQSPSDQRQTIHHEYFHALQRSLSATRSTRANTEPPLWLTEGSAVFFENAATPRDLEAFRRAEIRRWEARPPLEALEQSGDAPSVGGTADAYTVGAVAVDYMVKTYGRERIQSEFWLALAETDWRSAFEQVFGNPVETFYAEFATYRQTLRP